MRRNGATCCVRVRAPASLVSRPEPFACTARIGKTKRGRIQKASDTTRTHRPPQVAIPPSARKNPFFCLSPGLASVERTLSAILFHLGAPGCDVWPSFLSCARGLSLWPLCYSRALFSLLLSWRLSSFDRAAGADRKRILGKGDRIIDASESVRAQKEEGHSQPKSLCVWTGGNSREKIQVKK